MPSRRRPSMHEILWIVLAATAQPPAKADEVKKLEAELAGLEAKVQEVKERLRKAREVTISFEVKSERSLEDPSFRSALDMLAWQYYKPGECVVMGPELLIAVNKGAKTVFVRGQPE